MFCVAMHILMQNPLKKKKTVSCESGGTFSVPNIPVSDIHFCRPVARRKGHEDMP